jgi:LysR family hydrogen peroxide-inducible transcriptional activator
MEIHQLTYFVAVAETGNFSRAAERCNITQPSLSQQIMKLEQELGEALFERLPRKVVLTDAGRILLPRAHSILGELQDIKHTLNQNMDAGHGLLHVGFIPTIAPFVLPRVIKRFSLEYPNANLTVQEDLTEALVRDLIDGKLDVGITSMPIHNKLIRTQELLTEPLLVASSRKNDIITRASIRVKELDDFPFIALSEMHCLGEQIQSFCHLQQLELNVVCDTSQLTTVQNCVALGLGLSLVPRALAVSDTSNRLTYRQLSDISPQRKIAAATHADRTPSFLAQKFIEIVREEYPT